MINVAIAEDDFRVAMIHEEFLMKLKGINIAWKALNGEETLKKLQEQNVDLLLLDIYMPDVMGIDLIPEIRKQCPTVDIIMITASYDKEMIQTSIRNGVIDYIIKPVTFERFKQTIDHYKMKKNVLEQADEIDQQVVDQLIGIKQVTKVMKDDTPKGIDPITLEKVKSIMVEHPNGITADEMGEKMGASRTTARRYLEYLISIEEGQAELSYGIVGRPERKYNLI